MAKAVKTSDGKCWAEGVEVGCPNEKTQTRNMTEKQTRKRINVDKAYADETERRRKFSWGV